MADELVEKRRFKWNITNYSRENLNEYTSDEYEESAPFEITLGNNRTEWRFRFYPKKKDDSCEFNIHKIKTDSNDFTMLLKLKNRDNTCFEPIEFSRNAEEIEPDYGVINLSPNTTIIEEKGESQTNATLKLFIYLELRQHRSSAKSEQCNSCDSATSSDLIVKIFDSKDFHDITIVCLDGKKIPAHRCVLAAGSSVFKTMLAADMLEKQSNIIAIDDIDSETMLEVLRFMYTNKAEKLDKIALKIIYAAEKYDLQKLKSLCVASMMNQITNDNVFEFITLADLYIMPDMLQKCMAFIDENYWTLKNSHHWKEMSNDLILKFAQYFKEVASCITLPAASLL